MELSNLKKPLKIKNQKTMTLDDIYHAIGQVIVDSIEEDWQIAQLSITRLDKYTSVSGTYKTVSGEEKPINDSNFGYPFSKLIHKLHALITSDGKSRWNKLKFKLFPTGKFEIDFIWDQEYQDEIDRLNAEARRGK